MNLKKLAFAMQIALAALLFSACFHTETIVSLETPGRVQLSWSVMFIPHNGKSDHASAERLAQGFLQELVKNASDAKLRVALQPSTKDFVSSTFTFSFSVAEGKVVARPPLKDLPQISFLFPNVTHRPHQTRLDFQLDPEQEGKSLQQLGFATSGYCVVSGGNPNVTLLCDGVPIPVSLDPRDNCPNHFTLPQNGFAATGSKACSIIIDHPRNKK